MNTIEALLLLARAKKWKEDYIPVPHEHVRTSGLEMYDLIKNQHGHIIACKVNKREYIKWLETTYRLFPKRTELLSVLRSSLRK